jgi:hypothetical protein
MQINKNYFIDDWIGTHDSRQNPYEMFFTFKPYGLFLMKIGDLEYNGNWRFNSGNSELVIFPPEQVYTISKVNNNQFLMTGTVIKETVFFIRIYPKLTWLDQKDDLL